MLVWLGATFRRELLQDQYLFIKVPGTSNIYSLQIQSVEKLEEIHTPFSFMILWLRIILLFSSVRLKTKPSSSSSINMKPYITFSMLSLSQNLTVFHSELSVDSLTQTQRTEQIKRSTRREKYFDINELWSVDEWKLANCDPVGPIVIFISTK